MKQRFLWLGLLVVLVLSSGARSAHAQASDSTMSDAEIEKLRDAAYVASDRVAVFMKILDARAKAIEDVLAKRHTPDTPGDLHDLIDQFGGITDELNDNLDEYKPKHRDLRKVLPKLLLATERWSTTLRAPADDPAYKIVRKIALDAVRDVHDAAAAMQPEQEAYFKAHPEAAKAEKDRESTDAVKGKDH